MQMPTTDTQKILDAISGLGSRMDSLESRQDEMIEMMQTYSTDVDARFTRHEEQFMRHEEQFTRHEERFIRFEERFIRFEKEQTRMRSVMVDKDYFDRKLGDFKGDIIAALKKGDQRVNTLVSTLKRKRSLTPKEADIILARPAFVPGRA